MRYLRQVRFRLVELISGLMPIWPTLEGCQLLPRGAVPV